MGALKASRSRLALVLWLAAVAVHSVMAGEAPGVSPVVGWVEVQSGAGESGRIAIIAHAYGLAQASGTFTLAVRRSGASGVARTGQTGAFDVAGGDDKVLARTAVDAAPSSAITIELRLLVGGKEVFTTVMKSSAAAQGRDL
jgi:hypothetical protein